MPRTTLVLLPGLLNTRRVFEHQIAALSDIADCIVPELWHYDTMGAMADAALAASIFHFGIENIAALKRELLDASIPVRWPC